MTEVHKLCELNYELLFCIFVWNFSIFIFPSFLSFYTSLIIYNWHLILWHLLSDTDSHKVQGRVFFQWLSFAPSAEPFWQHCPWKDLVTVKVITKPQSVGFENLCTFHVTENYFSTRLLVFLIFLFFFRVSLNCQWFMFSWFLIPWNNIYLSHDDDDDGVDWGDPLFHFTTPLNTCGI